MTSARRAAHQHVRSAIRSLQRAMVLGKWSARSRQYRDLCRASFFLTDRFGPRAKRSDKALYIG